MTPGYSSPLHLTSARCSPLRLGPDFFNGLLDAPAFPGKQSAAEAALASAHSAPTSLRPREVSSSAEVAVATTTAAATSEAATSTPRPWATTTPRSAQRPVLGCVNAELPAVDLLVVEKLNRLFGLLVAREFHERESPGAPGFTIVHDAQIDYFTRMLERVPETIWGRVERQVSNKNPLGNGRVLFEMVQESRSCLTRRSSSHGRFTIGRIVPERA